MINSIQSIDNNINNNVFGNVTVKKLPSDYWFTNDTFEVKKKHNKKNEELNLTILSPEEARKTNNFKVIGLSIATATVLTAATLFFFLKGGPKGLSKNFQKVRNYLDRKVQNAKLNNMGNTKLNKMYTFLVQKLDVALQKFEIINNFTTFKDVSFKILMYTTAFGTKIHDGITKMFERIGRQSVVNSYKKTIGRFKEAKAVSDAANRNILSKESYEIVEINGVKKTKAQWLAEIDKLNMNLRQSYEKSFEGQALTSRYLKIKKSVEDLKARFTTFKAFLTKEMVTNFVAESAIAKEKSGIQKMVKDLRKELSYSVSDLANDADDKIIQMTKSITYKDIDKINLLRTLNFDIKDYAKAVKLNQGVQTFKEEALRMKISNELLEFKSLISGAIKSKTMDEKVATELLNSAEDLTTMLSSFKQGKIEDILSIYKKLLSPGEYEVVEKSYNNAVKALDKSINIETEEFISKVRDLALGGAPTDILTILGSLATLGYNLGKSNSNEERTSISLKYGIPAIAGIGVSLYCNAKLFAGTKSLLIGSISTIIVNKIGSWADDMLKKYRESKSGTSGQVLKNKSNPQIQGSQSEKSEEILDLNNPEILRKFQQELSQAS